MVVNGGIKQLDDRGLSFDGQTGWIDAGDFEGECIAQPLTCRNGLSLGMRIKLDNVASDSNQKFIFDSGGQNGKGISVFLQDDKFFVVVGSKGLWQVSTVLEKNKWHFVLATWNVTKGLFLFIDGPLVTSSNDMQPLQATARENSNHITIGKANTGTLDTFGKFNMEMIAVFNAFVPDGRVYMSYSYSPPGQRNGNIRYVNARFINKGKTDVRIFPDRGVKKQIGYGVAKKSSTLLEFVLREGPLPYGMDFLVRKNDSDVILKLNDKEWIHVDAADDIQVVAEITITDDKVIKMVFSTKGIIPNFYPKKEKRPGTEKLNKSGNESLKTATQNKNGGHQTDQVTSTVVDAMLTPINTTMSPPQVTSSNKNTPVSSISKLLLKSTKTPSLTESTKSIEEAKAQASTTTITTTLAAAESTTTATTTLPATTTATTTTTTTTTTTAVPIIITTTSTPALQSTIKPVETSTSAPPESTTTTMKTKTTTTEVNTTPKTTTLPTTKQVTVAPVIPTTMKQTAFVTHTTEKVVTTAASVTESKTTKPLELTTKFPSRTKPLPESGISDLDNDTSNKDKTAEGNKSSGSKNTENEEWSHSLTEVGNSGSHRPGEGRTDTSSSEEGAQPDLVAGTCLTCKQEKIVISSEQNNNESALDNMKVLSSIHGSINTSSGSNVTDLSKEGISSTSSKEEGKWEQQHVEKGTQEKDRPKPATSNEKDKKPETTSSPPKDTNVDQNSKEEKKPNTGTSNPQAGKEQPPQTTGQGEFSNKQDKKPVVSTSQESKGSHQNGSGSQINKPSKKPDVSESKPVVTKPGQETSSGTSTGQNVSPTPSPRPSSMPAGTPASTTESKPDKAVSKPNVPESKPEQVATKPSQETSTGTSIGQNVPPTPSPRPSDIPPASQTTKPIDFQTPVAEQSVQPGNIPGTPSTTQIPVVLPGVQTPPPGPGQSLVASTEQPKPPQPPVRGQGISSSSTSAGGWTGSSSVQVGQSGNTGQGGTISIPLGVLGQLGIGSGSNVPSGQVLQPGGTSQTTNTGGSIQPGATQGGNTGGSVQTGKTQAGTNWQFQTGDSQLGISQQSGCVQSGGAQLCAGTPPPVVTTTTPKLLQESSTISTTTATTTTTTTTQAPTTTTTTTAAITTTMEKRTTKPITWRTSPIPTTRTPLSTRYITNPSPTNKISTTVRKTKKPTKSRVTYPKPVIPSRAGGNDCLNIPNCNPSLLGVNSNGNVAGQMGVAVLTPHPHAGGNPNQADIYNVYQQLPGQTQTQAIQIDEFTKINFGDMEKNNHNNKPVVATKNRNDCLNIPNCNPSVLGVNFNGKVAGQMGVAVLTPHPNGQQYTVQNHVFDVKSPIVAGGGFNQRPIAPYNQNQHLPNNVPTLSNIIQGGQQVGYFGQNFYPQYTAQTQQYTPQYQGNNFGILGSPQVLNWKDAHLKSRSKDGSEAVMDDEMLNSIKDISSGNLIYTSNNAKLDNISPGKLWRNSMLITINKGLPIMTSAHFVTDKEEEKARNLPSAGSKETLSGHTGATLLLNDIENGVIKSKPPLKTHGNIRKWQGGLKFDGKTAWVNANILDVAYLAHPSLATDGFAIGFKLMFDSSIVNISLPKYILDSGGTDGQGVSVFIDDAKMFVIVADSKKMWQVSTTLYADEWMYMMFGWKQSKGLYLYINGMKKGEDATPTQSTSPDVKSNDVIIGANRKQDVDSFMLMYIAAIDITPNFPDTKELLEFSPPVFKPDFVLTFSSLNGDSVRNYPNLKAHGTVRESRGVLQFDGVHAFLHDTGKFADTFIMMPSLDPAGLTFTVKFKFNRNMLDAKDEKFILDTGGWLGHGVSLFVHDSLLTAVVGSKGRVWVVQTPDSSFTSWSFVLITWRDDMGLYLYINGALVAKEKSYRYLIQEYEPFDSLTVGCSILKSSASFGRFQLAMISFFPTYTTIDELMKFSPPLVLRPTFDWFFMLLQNNSTLTSPPLKVNGDVRSNENGLTFDGRSGWLNAGNLQDSSEESAEIVCEHYQKEITCELGQTIKVAYANYGRTSEIPCQGKRKYITTNCKSKKSLAVAKSLCNGKRACRLKALNSVWGNACPGVIKYLDIRYQCVGDIQQDGKTQHGAHFLTNPSLTKKGITIAMKVRLDQEVERYAKPHYLVDSGGSQGNGVAVYLKDKNVFCEISTRNKTWSVNTPVESDDWLYILLTWSKSQGMMLYINGVIRSVCIRPEKTVQNNQNKGADILAIGKSTANESDTFARFQITLFTVLKTFTPKSESFRTFAYYVGRAITNAFETASMSQETVLICEYQSRTISCPADQVIEIVFANFGRTSSRPCAWGTHHQTNCTLPNAITTARERCNGLNSCELIAKNSMWKGNPCPGIIKYVEVKFICDEVGPEAVTKSSYIGNEDPNSLVIP